MSGRIQEINSGTSTPLPAPEVSSASLESIPEDCQFIVFRLVDLLDLFNLQRTSTALAKVTCNLSLIRFHAEAVRCPYTEDPTQTTPLARVFGCLYPEDHSEGERLSMLAKLFVRKLIGDVK